MEDWRGWTALHSAAAQGRREASAEVLPLTPRVLEFFWVVVRFFRVFQGFFRVLLGFFRVQGLGLGFRVRVGVSGFGFAFAARLFSSES